MIPVNELRINNYVYYNNKYYELGIITEIKTSLNPKIDYVGINNRIDVYYQTKHINPIPLTEEWLLKFGFTRHHANYSNGVIYIKNVPNNNEFVWGVYPFELGSGFVINKSKSLKYIHQLQNLHFALIGEELTLNK